jgi:hypothetical protein
MRRWLAHHEEQERAMNARRHSGAGRNPAKKIMLLAFALTANTCLLTGAHAAELGRLFYTPQQRAQLEAQITTSDSTDTGPRNVIVVNGVIQKQGGKRTVWINGQQQPPDHGNARSPATVPVEVPGRSGQVQLKVGQRLLLNTPTPGTNGEDKSEQAAPAKPATEEDN